MQYKELICSALIGLTAGCSKNVQSSYEPISWNKSLNNLEDSSSKNLKIQITRLLTENELNSLESVISNDSTNNIDPPLISLWVNPTTKNYVLSGTPIGGNLFISVHHGKGQDNDFYAINHSNGNFSKVQMVAYFDKEDLALYSASNFELPITKINTNNDIVEVNLETCTQDLDSYTSLFSFVLTQRERLNQYQQILSFQDKRHLESMYEGNSGVPVRIESELGPQEGLIFKKPILQGTSGRGLYGSENDLCGIITQHLTEEPKFATGVSGDLIKSFLKTIHDSTKSYKNKKE